MLIWSLWQVLSVVGIICAGIYPTVIVPLQIAYGGAERPARDPNLAPGFKKSGMWGEIDAASKQAAASELDPSLLGKARKLALGVGTAAGAFGSLVGAGGGVLIGPIILNTCPAVPQRIISGTSLAAVATTGATAGAVYWTSNCVDARSAALLATTAVLLAPVGARMTHRFDCQVSPHSQNLLMIGVVGSVAGFASGLLGIGGGTVVTPLLAMATGAAQQTVLGTSLVAMVLPSLVGLVQHQRLGNVDWRMAAALALGTTVGSYVGSNLAINAPAGVLEGIFAVGMLLLGRRTLAAAAKGVPTTAQ
eukprot:gene4984-5227_t